MNISKQSVQYYELMMHIFFPAIKITERHNILYETIGYLPEEQEAYVKVWYIAGISLGCVIVCTVIEAGLFLLYNEKFHPFKNIIKKLSEVKGQEIELPQQNLPTAGESNTGFTIEESMDSPNSKMAKDSQL